MPRSALLVVLLGTSCTTLLGVEDAVLDEGASGSTSTTSSGASTSAAGGSSSASSGVSSGVSTASASSPAGGGGPAASTGAGGDGGGGGGGGESASSTSSTSSTSTAEASSGAGGDGGAGGTGPGTTSSTGGSGGGGGATTSSTAGSGSTGAGGGGGGGACALPAVPRCPGVQANTFSVASDLSTRWDILAPQADITVSDLLQLRAANGSSGARIQAKVALDMPASCGAWIRFGLPSTNAGVESGLAIETANGPHAIFHLEGEVRVRTSSGDITVVPYDSTETAMIRARFDAAGDLWFDTSPDGACWVTVEGPFVVDDGPLDVQLFLERPGTSGSVTSTFDDYSL